MSATTAPSLRDLASATPSKRDRYVDFLRALSIGVVVFGHWLMAIVYFDEGRVSAASALDVVPGLWLLTWMLQVMPVFFFVGGFSNLVSWDAARRRDEDYGSFLRGRIERLMRPTAVFIGVWLGLEFVLEHVAGAGEAVRVGTAVLAKPVWFLAVYILVVALSPAMIALHRRYRTAVPIALAVAAVCVDVLRIAFDLSLIGYLNFAFVWLFVHQLGFFYADGTLARRSKRFFALVGGAGVGSLLVLTNIGVYAPSMVGTNSNLVSNNDPPSVCLIALTAWLVGLVMLARPAITKILQGRRAWAAVIAANSMIMTVFLWHLTALMVAVAIAYPLGFPQPPSGSTAWWATRPLWIALLSIFLSVFVWIFGRYERPRSDRVEARGAHPAGVVAGIALVVVGMGGFAQGGFAGLFSASGTELGLFEANPSLSALHLACGLALIRGSRLPSASLVLGALATVELWPGTGSIPWMPTTVPNGLLHVGAAGAAVVSLRRKAASPSEPQIAHTRRSGSLDVD